MRATVAATAFSIAALGLTGVAGAHGDPHNNKARAHGPHKSNVYRAVIAGGTIKGTAQLVDGKRTNKLSLHVRGLAPRTAYLWHIHQGSCAATGAPLPGWTYRTQDSAGNGTFTSNHAGNANTKGRSATFDADPSQSYSVNIHLANGTVIACGDLKPRGH